MDNISAKGQGTVYDFAVSPTKERFYLVSSACDSLHFNGTEIVLEEECIEGIYSYPRCLLGVNPNEELSFLKKIGVSGGQVLTTDTSVLLLSYFTTDTLFLTDTFFVKPIGAHPKTTNMAIMEYGFNGELKRIKYWPWVNDCRYDVIKINAQNEDYYIHGSFSFDTLIFDGQSAPMLTWGGTWTDVFTAKINGTTWECEWIRATGGLGADAGLDWDVGNDGATVATGYGESTQLFCDEDTVQTGAGWNTDVVWMGQVTNLGDCAGFANINSFGSGNTAAFFSDNCVVMGGSYYSTEAYFDDTVLVNPNSSNHYISFYNENNSLRYINQFESEVSPNIRDMAITTEDAVWVTGMYSKNWRFNGYDYNVPAEDYDVFLMKLDKNGQPLYVTSFGGKTWDSGMMIKKGNDNNAYMLMLTLSDTVEINGEEHYSKYYYGNILVEIKDMATDIKEVDFPKQTLNIYPNPISTNQELHYEISGFEPFQTGQTTLYSIFGLMIATYPVNSEKGVLQLPDLPMGMYLLQFENKGGKGGLVKKIIVD